MGMPGIFYFGLKWSEREKGTGLGGFWLDSVFLLVDILPI